MSLPPSNTLKCTSPLTMTSWSAKWIWLQEDSESDMMLARRSFELRPVPEKAYLRITASSVYQLWINGVYIAYGPSRSAPHHQYYDTFDISAYLHQGRNVIAVRVHDQQGTMAFHLQGRGGLLAQLDLDYHDKIEVIATNDHWEVSPDPSWDSNAPVLSRFNLQKADRVDFRHHIHNWQIDGPANTWTAARMLRRHVGWPGKQDNDTPHTLTPPWTSLHPRDVPCLLEHDVVAKDLIEGHPVSKDDVTFYASGEDSPLLFHALMPNGTITASIKQTMVDYRKSNGPIGIPPTSAGDDGYILIFDLGTVHIGMPQLELSGASGTTVDIVAIPYIYKGEFTPAMIDSRLLDRIILSGRRDLWRSVYFKPTRYLGLYIHGNTQPVKLYSVGVHTLEYPFEKMGTLSTPEAPWIEAYWRASEKTLRVCTTDAYTDNYRERRQYAQTAYYATLGNYWTFGDYALQRRYLSQIAQEQQGNGLMPACAPIHGDAFLVFLDSNCLWLRGYANYYLFSGDETFTRKLLPNARKLFDFLKTYTNEHGLLDNPPYAYWLDHALLDRRGANLCLNGHYIGALEDFSEVLNWLGEPNAEMYHEHADRARKAVSEQFWNEDRGLFCDAIIDGEQSPMFSEHSNAMAMIIGAASQVQGQRIAKALLVEDNHDYVRRESGIVMVTPAMSYFLHEGLCRMGYVRESLDLFTQRFDHMLAPGTNQTLWEEWWLFGTGRSGQWQATKTRSDAQTESAFAPALLAKWVLGIWPTQPGCREVSLTRPQMRLKQTEGTFPSILGDLAVRWDERDTTNRIVQLDIPEGMRIKVDVVSLNVHEGKLRLDGKMVQSPGDSFTIESGSHIVEY